MRNAFLLLVVTVVLLVARAQASLPSRDWVVVAATDGPMTPLVQRAADEISVELGRRGRGVWPSLTAARQFERNGSAEPVRSSSDEIERWVSDSQTGLRHLALGEYTAALQSLAQAEKFSRAALTFLNRDEAHAQQVLDTCLYLVRALLEMDQDAAAREHALQCVSLSPGTKPRELIHPPQALALLEEARRSEADPSRRLHVENGRDGCTVRINGATVGTTPFESPLPRDGVYAVQVECRRGEQGRIHLVEVGRGTTELRVDPILDEAVRTLPTLRLELSNRAPSDVRQSAALGIADALPARWVLVVSQASASQLVIDIVSRSRSRMGCVRVPVSASGVRSSVLRAALENALEGRCADASASSAAAPAALGSPLFKSDS